MKHIALPAVMVGLLAGACAMPAAGDEIDDLVKKLNPPARFGGHRPQFHFREQTFTFQEPRGPIKRTWRLIMDGNRYVALLREGDIQLLARSPAAAPTVLRMPTGRYHLDNLLGPSLPTHAFIQKKVNYTLQGRSNVNETDHFRFGGKTMTLVRRYKGGGNEVLSQFALSVHPIFGYMIEGRTKVTFRKPPTTNRETTSGAFCPGCYVPWPNQWIFDRTVFCPGGTTEYRGWANNLLAMDRVDSKKEGFTWRDGGFIAYLNRKTGWSLCRTRDDGGPDATMSLRTAHNDFHIKIPFPDELAKDEAEREVYQSTHRMFCMPPELTKHVWDNMKLIPVGKEAVIIRIGTKETFEDQPIALTEPVRGLVWTSNEPKLTDRDSYSGKKSLIIKGTEWPNLPQVSLLPNRKYRLEAMFKVKNLTGEERLEHRRQHDLKAARDRRAGQQVEPYVALKKYAEAYITGHLYEWTPHDKKWLVRQQTSVASGQNSDWQKVELEFTCPKWDAFINIVFVVDSGWAYMDDFSLMRVP
jgi:hypothetical protein